MAFDKAKSLRVAEKHLELGKIPAAIKEYTRIVECEPDDFATLNTLGDLYVRVGDRAAAISCFRRIAEHYREQDFALKAIAVYKKIDRLQPYDTEIATNLADLYAQQRLVVEARAHYLAVADAHSRKGATQEALEILRKIADLDPQNTAIRIKLAEGYLNESMNREAATAFIEAGQHLLARGALDEALEVFTKSLEIYPADYASLKGLLAAHSARGTADEAAEIIERAANSNTEDTELLSMWASACVAAEDAPRAERATAALVGKESPAYLRYLDVARLYLRSDKPDDAVRIVGGIAEQMLAEREENRLLELINESLTCDADNVQALRLLVRTYWWQRDTEKLRAALERLAEAAQAAGLDNEERYALTQLTRIAPDQAHHASRLMELGGAADTEELPAFQPADEPVVAETNIPTGDKFALDSQITTTAAMELEWNSVEDITKHFTESANESSHVPAFTFETVIAEELPSNSEGEALDTSLSDASRYDSVREQELKSVDFYIAQGYLDIALDTLDLLEQQFGPHAEIDLRRQELQQTRVPTQESRGVRVSERESLRVAKDDVVDSPAVVEAPNDPAVGKEQVSTPSPPGLDPGLAEVFEEYRLLAESQTEARANGDYETHYNLGLAYQEMDLFEDALEEFQIAVGLASPGDGTPRYLQCCNLLGHCFMRKGIPQLAVKWFEKGLNTPGASEDERQAFRYELGAAFEEIGDLDRARNFFTEVYGINVSYRGVNERLKALQARVDERKGKSHSRTTRKKR